MSQPWYLKFNEDCRGYPGKILEIILEVLIVYLISNTQFIFMALLIPSADTGETLNFNEHFLSIIDDKVNEGELLTFVCSLIAPVIFWCFVEPRKIIRVRILLVASICLYVASVFLYGAKVEFASISNLTIYFIALAVWIVSVIFRLLPPDPPTDRGGDDLVRHLRGRI